MFKFLDKGSNKMAPAKKLASELDFASAEAYNLLRTNVSFALAGKDGGAKLFGVSSPCPQEGKSFTSINLSYALAKDGHKVLLIDADMRRPSVSTVLELSRTPGLSNVLAGANPDETIHYGTLHENLDVLLSGDIPPNPSELLGSPMMQRLIGEFGEKYDYIVVDLPPVTAVADPLIMSKMLDGIIVVVRHAYTRKRNIREAVRQLHFSGVRILGFVYNGYHHGSGRYYKKSKYYRKDYAYKENKEA
ncbi:MAG: CpsD/CapB family tyrosine-protein kinase [Clostridia bacterium]|nr:CpsD/CapB family tyrosine-protein kinase [Clostridia bacterium]